MTEEKGSDHWVVLDLETEGLNPKAARILECAAIHIGKKDLEAQSCVRWLVTQGTERPLDPVVQEMHTKNGLLAELAADRVFLRASNQIADDHDAHSFLDRSLAAHFASIGKPGSIVLVGSSVHFDRAFLQEHCPMAASYLHYRMVDVRVLKLVYREWCGKTLPSEESPIPHRAMQDCERVVEDLRWFSRNVFMNNSVML